MAGHDEAIGTVTVFLGAAEIVWREQVLPPLIRSASAARRRLAINAPHASSRIQSHNTKLLLWLSTHRAASAANAALRACRALVLVLVPVLLRAASATGHRQRALVEACSPGCRQPSLRR